MAVSTVARSSFPMCNASSTHIVPIRTYDSKHIFYLSVVSSRIGLLSAQSRLLLMNDLSRVFAPAKLISAIFNSAIRTHERHAACITQPPFPTMRHYAAEAHRTDLDRSEESL